MTSTISVTLAAGMLAACTCGSGCSTVRSRYDYAAIHGQQELRSAAEEHNRQVSGSYGLVARQHAERERTAGWYGSTPQPAAAEPQRLAAQPRSAPQRIATRPQPEVEFNGPAQDQEQASQLPGRINLYGELVGITDAQQLGSTGTENLSQVTFAVEGACRSPHIDSSGRWMTFSATIHRPTADIYLKSVDGRALTQLTTDPADDLTPQFSPTGDMIAFASNRSGNWDIWMMPTEGGAAIQVTDSAEHELNPTFSSDGRQVAYCRYGFQSGRWEIWVCDLGRPGVQRFLTYGLFPQWSPDRLRPRIVFQRPRERGSRNHSVWTLDYRNGEATNISEIVSAGNAAVMHPSWSPDGDSIVFISVVEPDPEPGARPQVADVWAIDADGRNRRNLTRGDFSNLQPMWATDGRVYFVSDRSGVENIWSVRASDEHHLRTWHEDIAGARGDR